MVVNDVELSPVIQPRQGGNVLTVHHRQPVHRSLGCLVGSDEGEFIPIQMQEVAHVAVEAIGNQWMGVRIQLGGAQQGCDRIKIGIVVSDNQVHTRSVQRTAVSDNPSTDSPA